MTPGQRQTNTVSKKTQQSTADGSAACFRLLLEHLGERPEVRLTRFRPDERKSGGVYETVSGIVKQIDSIARRIRLLDGTDIPMDDVLTLDGALFDVLD